MKLLVASAALLSVATALAQYTCEVLPLPAGMQARPESIYDGKVVGTASGRACAWVGENHSFRLLSTEQSGAYVASSGVQGGYFGFNWRAMMWLDQSRQGVSIHPEGFMTSNIEGMDGPAFAGWGQVPMTGYSHALLWLGFGSSVVDLHPQGFERTWARAVSGQRQVGVAQKAFNTPETAAMWTGSADTMQLLPLPRLAHTSEASTIRGNVIGGYFYGANGSLPIIWKVDDLTYSLLPMPTELYGGEVGNGFVSDTNGNVHVGGFTALNYPYVDRDVGAAWVGNPPRFVNLNSFLPPQYANTNCHVTGIDEQGNITGWIQSIYIGNLPVIWKPIHRDGS